MKGNLIDDDDDVDEDNDDEDDFLSCGETANCSFVSMSSAYSTQHTHTNECHRPRAS